MLYQNIKTGLDSSAKLVPYGSDLSSIIKDPNKDWYGSLFYYNEEQYKQFQSTHSIRGITDVITDKLYFDFDAAFNLEQARQDTMTCAHRLEEQGIPFDAIRTYWSGNKGFNIEVYLTDYLNPDQFAKAVDHFAGDLETFDKRIREAARILRIVNTKHPKSGLFKIYLSPDELLNKTSLEIRHLAQEPRSLPKQLVKATINHEVFKSQNKPKSTPVHEVPIRHTEIDFRKKPSGLTNCRWALQNGYFEEGNRNSAFLCLAATYRNQGYPIEIAFRMLKGVAELQARRNNCDKYPNNELWNNICTQVYSEQWRGGQYSCKEEGKWLKDYCDSLGLNRCKHSSNSILDLGTAFDKYFDYAINIDHNKITTGIRELDEKLIITIGQHIGILGAPSSGKSSLALQILENTSLQGVKSLFFSMDMSDLTTVQKLIQRVERKSEKEIFSIFHKKDEKKIEEVKKKISEKYKNVTLCFRNGLTIENIRELVIEEKKRTNNELKLVMIDYAARIIGPWSDSNSNGALIATGLRSIANELGVCVITLVQPPKSAGDAKDELTSMRQIKGSSVFEESLDILLGVFRPGFSPLNDSQDDNYMVMSTLKNRMGKLFTSYFNWDGLTGSITGVNNPTEVENIKNLIKKNKESKGKDQDGWS